MSTERTQVVVVGAGPVGLLLAGELRLGGAEVVVLEALAEPSAESRASTLHARTMEIFDSRGLLDALGRPPCDPRGHFGGIPLDLTLPGPYPGQWKVLQARTAQVLAEWARRLGADIRRGHAVDALAVHGDHVEVGAAGVRLRADYVVACDGERSTVRRLTGAKTTGREAGCELLRGDVAGIEVPDRRFQRLPGGLAIAARRPDGVTRVMVREFGRPPSRRRGEPAFRELAEAWQRVTGDDIGGGEPLWVNAFDDAIDQVTRYRDGRVLFAGDAAHRQPPIGGQALNLGLQDAANLGWKLAATVTGAPDDLLDSYHTERHPAGARTLANIAAQAGLLFGGPEVEPLRSVLAELMAEPATQARLAGMVTGLDVRYDFGEGLPEVVGARLPPGELVTASGPVETAALLREGRGLLLLLGDADGSAGLSGSLGFVGGSVGSAVGLPALGGWGGNGGSAGGSGGSDGPLDSAGGWRKAGGSRDSAAGSPGSGGSPDSADGSPGSGTSPGPAAGPPHSPGPGEHPDLRRIADAWSDRVRVVAAGAVAGLPSAVLVRPDGHVAWVSGTPVSAESALRRWFGSPRTGDLPLAGKTALVTEAGRGPGRAVALRLAGRGARVAVHFAGDRAEDKEAADEVVAAAGRAFAVRADLGDPAAVDDLVRELAHTCARTLDILVTSGAPAGRELGPLLATAAAGPFRLVDRALALVPDGGRIVTIAPVPEADGVAAEVAAAAAEALAKGFARRLGPRGITVNHVVPGGTGNAPLPDVVAALVAGDAHWITGTLVAAGREDDGCSKSG
ncbi:SDR family oxidoreductase [Amycolatopsis sp. MEPSY49]|uniref:SDR family oxidoreductase n=1 Tax=Amycolatopsis sp. MEPSY49 TaxID=3151600 RepID=UPI003EF72978